MKGNSDELTRGRGDVGTLKKPSAKKSNQKLLVPPESPASPERQKGPLRSRCPGAALRRPGCVARRTTAANGGETERVVSRAPRCMAGRGGREEDGEGALRRAASAGAVSGVPVAAAIRSWPERVNNDSV